MKKRILALLLAMVMIFGMLPVTAFAAAVELPIDGGVVDITDAAAGPYTISTLSVYLQGSYEPVSILSATQDGTTINIILAEDTDPSAALQAGLGGSGQGTLQHSGNKCTLSNGTGTMNYSFTVRLGPQAVGSGNYTVNFSMPMGEAVSVTPPSGEGFTFTSDGTAYKDQPYTFKIAVKEGYDGSNMTVAYKFGEETTALTPDAQGNYTIDSVPGDITIVVSGVTAREKCNITRDICEGVTFSGAEWAYAGDPYTFSVAVDGAYDATGMVVKVGEEEVELTNGSYTIPSVTADTQIAVTDVVKKSGYSVTWEEGTGYTITGQATSYAGESYTFTVTVDDSIYWADRIVVKVNEEPVALTDGSYTIEALNSDTTITVENVVERQLFTIAKPEVDGITFTGGENVREGKPYTFSVAVDAINYLATDMVVKVNGEEMTLTNGSYTIDSVGEELVITVEGVRAKTEYTVTKIVPDGMEDVTIYGNDTVLETDTYTFTVTVPALYNTDGMKVTYQMGEATAELDPGTDGQYTIPSVTGNVTVTVSGLIRSEVCQITEPTGKKFTFTDDVEGFVYKNSDYTFTVTPQLGYEAAVAVNGQMIAGTDNQYTVENVSEDLVITVTTTRVELPDKELTVTDDNGAYTVGITSNKLATGLSSSYYANITGIKITGAEVVHAYEDNKTVFFLLDQDTPDDATVDIEFLHTTSNKNVKLVQSKWSLALVDGEGGMKTSVTVRYSSFNRYDKSCEYTLIFFRDIPAELPPVRLVETDTAEVWRSWPLEINLGDYFTDADTYYLVDGENRIPLDGKVYTYVPDTAGEHTLIFAAVNEAGECPDFVTVTVTVKDIESGVYIGHASGNGSMDAVLFKNAQGELIEGIEVTYADKKITVLLPKDYDVSGSVQAVFSLTQNASGYPFISTSTETTGNRAYNSRFTEKSIALTNGAANFTFYYYNKSTGAVDNGGQTKFTIELKMKNDLPVLAEGVEANGEATITAGQEFILDLTPLFTDVDGDALTYLVSIDGAEPISADGQYTFTTDVAKTYTLAFTANDGKGTSTDTYTVTLTVKDSEDTDSMTVCVPEGLDSSFFAATGYGEDGIDTQGAALTAVAGETADGLTTYTLRYPVNVTEISVRTSDWGGMAFPAQKDGAVVLRKAQLTVVDYDDNPAVSTNTVTYDDHTAVAGTNGWLLVAGKTYTFTAVPENTTDFKTAAQTVVVEAGSEVYTLELMFGINNAITITATTGAKAQLYNIDTSKYYAATEFEAKIIEDNGDGTTTHYFSASGNNLVYRVSMEGKITKMGYFGWNQKSVNAVYDEDDKSDTYRLNDYSGTGYANSGMTEDSVLLNINAQNHLAMTVGQTKTLKAYRAWEIIKISYQNYILTPDFTYTILSGSDVVSLTEKESPSTADGDWMTLTALKEGVAVIEVTYGAVEVTGGSYDGIYGASDPARTGLVVVQVGGNDSSVNFGIDCFASSGIAGSNNITYNPNSKRAWDAEFDTLYFTGDSGELSLTPTAGSAITEVAVSYNKGASWTVLTGSEGTYTAKIVSGNNIIRVTTTSGTAYQVVRGDQISVRLNEVADKSDGDGVVEAGETVRVTLVGLHMPIPKMAGNYNPGFLGNSDGYSGVHLNYSVGGEAIYSTGAQYNFITTANSLEITMPADGSSVTLSDGYIGTGVIGLTTFTTGGDSHRNIPDNGCGTRGSQTTYHTRCILPEITIQAGGESAPNSAPIVRADAITEGSIYNDQKFAINPDTLFQDADGDTLTFTVSVNGGEATAIGTDYKFVPEAVGTYTLTFTASDDEETVQHTVTVTVTERPQIEEPENDFGLEDSEIAGYVTISFEDNGVRVAGEKGLKFPVPLGTIIEPTKVPYKEDENIAQVTKRLLDHLGIGMEYSGTLESGFYLGAITNFEVDGTPYDSMAEFDAGVGSGWMITQNGTFINQGASEFKVNDGDILKWQYSCQLGADIGDDFYADVNNTIKLIDEIGEVTLDSGEAIRAARDAYDKLTESEKQRVSNYQTLIDAEAKYAELTKAAADEAAANAVEEKIAAIGTVTLDSKDAIQAARAAYDALTDAQKELVDNYQLLTDAETAYAELVKTVEDEAAAKAVADMIDAIGTVTLDSEEKITAARKAYDALSDVQKALVSNRDKLEAAEKKLAELKDEAAADAVEAKIAAIGTVTLDSEEKINAARTAYNALTDAQKALVENLSVLEAAEETLELLKLAGADVTDIYKTTGDYLAGLSAPVVGTINGEWRVIGLSRAGRAVADSYYEAVVQYVKENIDQNGRLHAVKSTDNSRLIIALTAIGKDVTDVGGYDLLSGLNEMEYIGKQGINGTIWALIAFDAHNYEIPAGDVSRENLVQAILDAQVTGGGWTLSGSVGDPDMTGMALQALAPYYSSNSDVKKAVDKALTWLSGVQNKDGTFTGSEGTTAESLAQVITALTALGINPETDSRFIKNGVSTVDALSQFYVEGGGFKHDLSGDRNMMATEQGYYALVSYYRLLQSKTSLYDMSDVNIQTAAKDQEAAEAVEALINAIGTVTKDSGEKIKAARDAYDKLTDVQKALVGNYKVLTDAEATYAELVKTAEDEAAAKAVEDKIDTIGTVTLDSESKIKEARKAYEALTDIQKALVSNLDKLEAAEKALAELKDEATADAVEKLIDAIGKVTKDSGEKIKAARDAYDELTEAQKKLVENYKTLTDAESKFKELNSTAEVSFTLLGCYKHDSDEVHTLSGGNLRTWIAKKTYKVEPGTTVKDVLEMALKDAGMSCKNPTGNYVESINGIGEFSNGSNSGWMYTLNGTHPGLGVAEQAVKDGDVIVFHYTDDYSKEEGGTGFGEDTAIQKVEDLIDAIGTVTLDSKDKIDAARKAYDNLTYAQKQEVSNYAKLTAAEAKYAELKKADDEKKADAVESLIDKIDTEITLDSEAEITAARKAYDALTADQKKLVSNYKKLTDAEYDLALLKADEKDKEAAEAVEKLIDAIGVVTLDSEEKIAAARKAYDKLTVTQKNLVKNYADLLKAEEKLAVLKELADVENAYTTTGNYLEALGTPVPGSVGGEWMVIGLLRSGRQLKDADSYYDAVVKFVQENIDENGRLHNAKSTENSRMILALTAMGKDVTNVGGHNLLIGLNSMEYVRKQGINGPIWALMALDCGNYPVPEGDVTREALIQVLLDAQLADGGWALTGTVSDPDITGMALQALAPYCETNAEVQKAVDEAIAALSMMQASDGSFASIDGSSSESIAQVVTGLAALGIDADTDPRFIKNGNSALDALYAFYVQGGGFKHIPDGKLDGMATEQSYYALAAYFRMLEGKTALFDMTDVIDKGGDKVEEEPTETQPVPTEPAPTEPAETPAKEGRSFPWWLVIVIVVLAGAIVVLVIISKPKKGNYVR